MDGNGKPDVLVRRIHALAVQHGLTSTEMARRCGLPKSSLECCMRLEDAKRPGVDALLSIADAMGVLIDWIVEVLRVIEAEQAQTAAPIVQDGKVGARSIEDFAELVMLHFVTRERPFEDPSFDGPHP